MEEKGNRGRETYDEGGSNRSGNISTSSLPRKALAGEEGGEKKEGGGGKSRNGRSSARFFSIQVFSRGKGVLRREMADHPCLLLLTTFIFVEGKRLGGGGKRGKGGERRNFPQGGFLLSLFSGRGEWKERKKHGGARRYFPPFHISLRRAKC